MRRRAGVTAAAAVISAAVCWSPTVPAWIRAGFAIALLLWLPGLALRRVLFRTPLDPVHGTMLALGLSIVVSIIGGVELGAAGLLSTESWALLTAGATVAASTVSGLRGDGRSDVRGTGAAPPSPAHRRRPDRAALLGAASAAAALAVVAASVGLARTPLPVPDDRGYTVLSIDGDAGQPASATLTMRSSEADARDYTLVTSVPGAATESIPIRIEPGDTLQRRLTWPLDARGVIRASLMRAGADGRPAAYRRVRLSLPLLEPPPIVTTPTGR